MRLRQFHAPSVPEAMQKVRENLGDEAIILGTREDPEGGVQVTAALEDDTLEDFAGLEEGSDSGSLDEITEALSYHKVPRNLSQRLLQLTTEGMEDSWTESFSRALASIFRFGAVDGGEASRPLMLVGMPGAGRTAVAARLALSERMAGNGAQLITVDSEKAGGLAQISVFAKALQADLSLADSPEALAKQIEALPNNIRPIIDTWGCNPFDNASLHQLSDYLEAANAKPVLVLAAGADSAEAAENALAFASLGIETMIATKIDLARRYGGILSAAFVGGLTLSGWSRGPQLGETLQRFHPDSLVDLMIPEVELTEFSRATGSHQL